MAIRAGAAKFHFLPPCGCPELPRATWHRRARTPDRLAARSTARVGHAAETAQSAAFRPSARHAARTRRARRASPLHTSVRRAGEGHAGASDRSGLARPRATPEGSRRTFGRRTTLPMCHAHLGSTARANHPSHSSMEDDRACESRGKRGEMSHVRGRTARGRSHRCHGDYGTRSAA